MSFTVLGKSPTRKGKSNTHFSETAIFNTQPPRNILLLVLHGRNNFPPSVVDTYCVIVFRILYHLCPMALRKCNKRKFGLSPEYTYYNIVVLYLSVIWVVKYIIRVKQPWVQYHTVRLSLWAGLLFSYLYCMPSNTHWGKLLLDWECHFSLMVLLVTSIKVVFRSGIFFGGN